MSPVRPVYLLLGGWFLLLNFPAVAETLFFRSNSLGMQLEPIKSQTGNNYDYVLEVRKEESQQTQILFSGDKEIKTWVYYYDKNLLKEKWERVDGVPQLKEIYNSRGELGEEVYYTQGAVKEQKKYSYDNNGLLQVSEVFDAQGKPLYSERYAYHGTGMLREILRLLPDGTYQLASYSIGGGKLFEERYGSRDLFYINRFDDTGHLVISETWRSEKLIYKIKREYQTSGKLAKVVEENPGSNTLVTRRYNEQGQLLDEESNEQRDQGTLFSYDGKNRIVKKYKKGSEGAEEWRYEYDDNDQVKKEIYLHRGTMEKITYYSGQADWQEEIFRNGELFLRVYYEKNEKVKDEFIKGGEIISERLYK